MGVPGLLLLTAIFVSNLGIRARGDFLTSCPAPCNCKWSGGKRTADCAQKSFTTIPNFLSTNIDNGIQVLYMDGNYITELGKNAFSAVGLVDVQKISLKNCHIQKVHRDAFAKLNILTEINLEGNNISKLELKTFDGNKGLQSLVLSRNQISHLKGYQFPPLSNLKKIYLANTGLKEVSQKAFNNLGPSVEEIDLSGNHLRTLQDTTFLPLSNLKTLKLHDNPWVCDCKLKSFRDYTHFRSLNNGNPKCYEPDRLADRTWSDVESLDFACKPEISVYARRVYAEAGWNVTLTCHITGNPVPSPRWVLGGRVIHDKAPPLHSTGLEQQYHIHNVALAPDGIERNFSLTITNVRSEDEGDYNCVAINQGGMAEKNITLTFSHPTTWPGELGERPDLAVLIGAASGGVLFIIVVIITLCCICRRRGKDKTGHTHNGSLLAYADPAGEKLLAHQGTMPRTNPVAKPPRGGEYGILPTSDQELAEYGPSSYVPGDRYDEYGEGRTSASNSDQTGTLSRASYHSSDPDQYPDLLDIPNRLKAASPTSICTAPLPPLPFHAAHPQQQQQQQPLNPVHLISPPHLHHHHHHHHNGNTNHHNGPSPFGRTGTLPHNYTMGGGGGTLPHQPRSVSCDHTAAAVSRTGYCTLPRRPRASWAGVRDGSGGNAAAAAAAGGGVRDTPSPSCSLRDPIYDGVGPRTSADGSSKLSLNRSIDAANGGTPRGNNGNAAGGGVNGGNGLPNGRVPVNGSALPAAGFIAPIDESPEIRNAKKAGKGLDERKGLSKRSPITCSQQTLLEENLADFCEPFGAAVPPDANNRDSIASNDSEILHDKKDKQANVQPAPVMCSTPKSNNTVVEMSPPSSSNHHSPHLQTIPEGPDTPTHSAAANGNGGKRLPPPTLPKPKNRPQVPAKPVSGEVNGTGEHFQDETIDGSEV